MRVQMCDHETINDTVKVSHLGKIGKVGKASLVTITHVHTTIKHDVFASKRDYNATPSNILTSAEWKNADL